METDYFDIVADELQGDTLAPYLIIICIDYVLRTSVDKIKENGFKLIKEKSRRYPVKTITDANYADDIALLENAPAQAETLLHSQERAATGIGLHVNAHTRCIRYVSRPFSYGHFYWNSSLLRSNLLWLQCTWTVPTTSGRPHGSFLVWACQWPLLQPPSSPQLSHNDSLWA